jgi:hypothetical protein
MKSTRIFLSIVLIISFLSCNRKENDLYKPFTFNTNSLDSMVRLKEVILDQSLRDDGTLRERKYYLGDTVKYLVTYNKEEKILNVSKFQGPEEVWTENYYPNGQRLSRYEKKMDSKTGMSHFNGFYEAYYETGWVKERGMYKMDNPDWMVTYTESGLSGDTIVYVNESGK